MSQSVWWREYEVEYNVFSSHVSRRHGLDPHWSSWQRTGKYLKKKALHCAGLLAAYVFLAMPDFEEVGQLYV